MIMHASGTNRSAARLKRSPFNCVSFTPFHPSKPPDPSSTYSIQFSLHPKCPPTHPTPNKHPALHPQPLPPVQPGQRGQRVTRISDSRGSISLLRGGMYYLLLHLLRPLVWFFLMCVGCDATHLIQFKLWHVSNRSCLGRWTSTIVALPIVMYTSWILYERSEFHPFQFLCCSVLFCSSNLEVWETHLIDLLSVFLDVAADIIMLLSSLWE